MIYFQGTTDFYMAGPSVITLGKFDGVHRGHQKLFQEVKKQCAQIPGASGVVFALNARQEDLLLTDEEQKTVLENMGMDCLIRCPFVPSVSGMMPDAFAQRILHDTLHAVSIVVGTDFRFGYQRSGDAAWLKQHGEEFGFSVTIVEKETWKNGREISSTYMREALSEGDMQLVHDLSGRYWSIEGPVVHGAHLGTGMGMPTCNLVPAAGKLLPPNGVYYSRSSFANPDGTISEFSSITNIGWKPTVGGTYRGAETYLYNTEGNFYNRQMKVELLQFVRPEQKFESLDDLKKQISHDIIEGKEYFRLT